MENNYSVIFNHLNPLKQGHNLLYFVLPLLSGRSTLSNAITANAHAQLQVYQGGLLLFTQWLRSYAQSYLQRTDDGFHRRSATSL